MKKAIFMDFYGTVVFEDGEVIEQVTNEILDTGKADNASGIASYWWREFQNDFMNSYGENFQTQRALEHQSLEKTIRHFNSTADAKRMSDMMFDYWMKPPIFEEAKEFFKQSPVPIYIVSNIDRGDILKAIKYHGLNPKGVFTSEDARSYKPRRELFEMALEKTGLNPDEVIHIGDSLSSDVAGAGSVGIDAIWVNRAGKEIPKGVKAVSNLLEALKALS